MTASPTFNRAYFKATHNSYSGEARGSITEQLDAGVRGLELDFYNQNYASKGFEVGHKAAGSEVSHDGNPASNNLADWLGLVQQWCVLNPDHDPITLFLEAKVNLVWTPPPVPLACDPPPFSSPWEWLFTKIQDGQGNLNDLIKLVKGRFGASLFKASSYNGTWPTVDGLRGKVLTVLIGDECTRCSYANPDNNYEQVFFADNWYGDIGSVDHSYAWNAQCYAAEASDQSSVSWSADKQSQGKLVRLGKFSQSNAPGEDATSDVIVARPVNFPATDTPAATWYLNYCDSIDAFTDVVAGDEVIFNGIDGLNVLEVTVQGSDAIKLRIITGTALFAFSGVGGDWRRATLAFHADTVPSGSELVQVIAMGAPSSFKSTGSTPLGWAVDSVTASLDNLITSTTDESGKTGSYAYASAPVKVTTRVRVTAQLAVNSSSYQSLNQMAFQAIVLMQNV